MIRARVGAVTPFEEALDRFLFRPTDARTAAAFRVAVAAMAAWVFWPSGWDAATVRHVPGPDALYREVFLSRAWWLAALAALALFAAGVRPRLTGFAAALLLAPLVVRTGRFPGRIVMEFTLIAFSFLRSDAAFSPSRLGFRGVRASAGPIWPIRLIQIQLSVLYGVNALAKSTPDFLSGRVLMAQSHTLSNFRADMTDGVLSVGPLEVPVGLVGTAAALTEAALAVGFWVPPLRLATALLGVAFHAALTRIVQIGFLDWVSVFLYLAFLLPFERPAPAGGGGSVAGADPGGSRRDAPHAPASGAGAAAETPSPLPESGIIPI